MALKELSTNKKVEEEALSLGYTPLQSKILGNRLESLELFRDPSVSIPSPFSFDEGEKAINAIFDAIVNKKRIWLVSDFDNDGVGAMAASFYILTKIFNVSENLIRVQVTKRFDGYGLTQKAIDKMLSEESTPPDILITMDLGSSNGSEVNYLKSQCPNMDVIVTDHHDVPPKGYPEGITAFINPNKPWCSYPDKAICGAAVVFFVLEGVRIKMEKQGLLNLENVWTEKQASPFFALSYVASSTIADAVSMQSPVNRYIVSYGLNLMNQGVFPSWVALKNKMDKNEPISEVTLGWLLGPMINATSRLGEHEISPFKFFTSPSLPLAENHLNKMEKVNTSRKAIQSELYQKAMLEAIKQKDDSSLVIVLEDAYPGIAGVVAGRLVSDFKKPVFVLMPSSEGVYTGSCRAPNEFVILPLLRALPNGLLIKFGGHKSVAGLSISSEKIPLFKKLIDEQVDNSGVVVSSSTMIDFYFDGIPTFQTYNELFAFAPYGMGFSQPILGAKGEVVDVNNISKKTDAHKRIQFRTESGSVLTLNYFNAPSSFDFNFNEVAYTLGKNYFRGSTKLQFSLEGI